MQVVTTGSWDCPSCDATNAPGTLLCAACSSLRHTPDDLHQLVGELHHLGWGAGGRLSAVNVDKLVTHGPQVAAIARGLEGRYRSCAAATPDALSVPLWTLKAGWCSSLASNLDALSTLNHPGRVKASSWGRTRLAEALAYASFLIA